MARIRIAGTPWSRFMLSQVLQGRMARLTVSGEVDARRETERLAVIVLRGGPRRRRALRAAPYQRVGGRHQNRFAPAAGTMSVSGQSGHPRWTAGRQWKSWDG